MNILIKQQQGGPQTDTLSDPTQSMDTMFNAFLITTVNRSRTQTILKRKIKKNNQHCIYTEMLELAL
jgi:hypothetical protein